VSDTLKFLLCTNPLEISATAEFWEITPGDFKKITLAMTHEKSGFVTNLSL
jgi:hypothetical protein